MPEYMFRNLSVKVYPADRDIQWACVDRTTQLVQIDCSPFQTACGCTQYCTGTYQQCHNHTCFDPGSPTVAIPCDQRSHLLWCDPTSAHPCGPDSRMGSFVDDLTNVIIPPGTDIRQELAQLKGTLQRKMAAVDARQRDFENAAKPRSVEQIDELKSQLLAAVAELDEQRAQMEGGGQAPASE